MYVIEPTNHSVNKIKYDKQSQRLLNSQYLNVMYVYEIKQPMSMLISDYYYY